MTGIEKKMIWEDVSPENKRRSGMDWYTVESPSQVNRPTPTLSFAEALKKPSPVTNHTEAPPHIKAKDDWAPAPFSKYVLN